jgi:hypothetical protein
VADKPAIRQPLRRTSYAYDPWRGALKPLPPASAAAAIFGRPSDKAAPAAQATLRDNVGRIGAAAQIFGRLPSIAQPSSTPTRKELPAAKPKRWS